MYACWGWELIVKSLIIVGYDLYVIFLRYNRANNNREET